MRQSHFTEKKHLGWVSGSAFHRSNFHRPHQDRACSPGAGFGASFILSLPTLFLLFPLRALPFPDPSEPPKAWPASLLPSWPHPAQGPQLSNPGLLLPGVMEPRLFLEC